MEFAWTKQLSVGNVIIDSEHKYLVGIANNARRAIKARDSFMLSHEFERLENWLCIHFTNEEKIARVINFDFSQHKQEQGYALKELQHLRDELAAKDGIWCESEAERYSDFLGDWIIDRHIIKSNMLMKPALQTYAYTFWPGWQDGTNHAVVHIANRYLQFQA